MKIFTFKKIALIFLINILMCFATLVNAKTLLISNVLANSVTFVDDISGKTIKKISVGYMPHEIEVTADGKYAIVSNFGDIANIIAGHSISVIDIANAKVLQTIELGKRTRPHGIKIISENQALVTTQGIQSLLIVDFMSGNIIKKIALPGAGAHMVTTDAEHRFAYVTNVDSGSVVKVDLKTFSVTAETKIGKEAEGIALSKDENFLLITNRADNEVAVLRTKDLTILKKITTDNGPTRVVLFDQDKKAIVTNTISGSAQIIDIATLTITKTFKTTESHLPLTVPINVAINEDQKSAYIANSFACDVTLVNLETGDILKTIPSSFMPDGIVIL